MFINLKKLNKSNDDKVFINYQSKVKENSFWIIIADDFNSKIIAIKKVSFNNKKTLSKEIFIKLPDDFTKIPYISVYIKSDCYLGIDQVRKFKLTWFI